MRERRLSLCSISSRTRELESEGKRESEKKKGDKWRRNFSRAAQEGEA